MQRSQVGDRGLRLQENPFADEFSEAEDQVHNRGGHSSEGSYPDYDLYSTASSQSYSKEPELSETNTQRKYFRPFRDDHEDPDPHANIGRSRQNGANGYYAASGLVRDDLLHNGGAMQDFHNKGSASHGCPEFDGLLMNKRFSALPPLPYYAEKCVTELPLPPVPSARDPEKAKAEEDSTEKGRKKQLMRMPWFIYFVSAVQFCVLVAELVKMGILTGNPFQTKPSFNPMLGPSSYVMINMGARFTQCMRKTSYSSDTTTVWPCPNSTTTDTNLCSLSELCGFGMDSSQPSQSWRFVTAIFLHAGIIHLVVNLLIQIRAGGEIERRIGHIRFFMLYWLAGIGGFLLSGNYAGTLVASVGASGCVFGIIAFDLLDLLYNWPLHRTPWLLLGVHLAEIVVSLVLGLLPGIDNFAHIGGLIVGLLLGVMILRSPIHLRLRDAKQPGHSQALIKREKFKGGFVAETLEVEYKDLGRHFTGRHWSWWAWWMVRLAAFAILIVYFVLNINTFNRGDSNCSWCKYLSCIPVNNWCSSTTLGS